MGGGAHNDAMIAWPMAEVSFMDPVFATNIVHSLSAGDEGFEDALATIQKDLEIWDMARIFSAHDVIKPQETRDYLIRMRDVQRRRRTGGVGQHLMRTWQNSRSEERSVGDDCVGTGRSRGSTYSEKKQ